MNKYFVSFFLILIFLAVTNPDKGSFELYLESKYIQEKTDNLQDIVVEGIKTLAMKFTVVYENKVLFSIAKTRFCNERAVFVGILGHWFCVGRESGSGVP